MDRIDSEVCITPVFVVRLMYVITFFQPYHVYNLTPRANMGVFCSKALLHSEIASYNALN